MSSHSYSCNPSSIASSSFIQPRVWTCTICSLTLAVDDGPSHLASNDHIAHLSNFNASVILSRLTQLTLGYQGPDIVSADQGVTSGTWSSPNLDSSTIQTEAKFADTTTGGLSSTDAAFWICKICDRMMHERSKTDHLAGKVHAKRLGSKSSTILGDIPTEPLISVKKTWTCPSCKVIFAIREKAYHSCFRSELKSSTHDGPLDEFFQFYPLFCYDASAPPATSFKLLQRHLRQRFGWAHESPENDELWRTYQAALTQEFNLWFGVEDNLDAWHSLCRAVRVTPLPTSVELCRLVVRGRHVNIIDLIEWGRGRQNHIQIFPTVKKLSDYSFESHKIFNKDMVDELEAGAILKHLLRPLEAARYWDE